ncbi:MurR/RpiR family transcriptional regulator [Actinomadura yumaensis]|uniref:MurR/RpiR family transcriptional regulator n=1 Tax=Actinomadura yumaensis TaxID=111807 RepID=UPI003624578B
MRALTEWLDAHRTSTPGLGPRAGRVLRVLAREPHFASYASARAVAERAQVNTSTVVRTAQQLGFAGWPDLRTALRTQYLRALGHTPSPEPIAPPSEQRHAELVERSVDRSLGQDAANLAALAEPRSKAAIRALADAITTADRTLVIGTGTAAGPAHILAHLATNAGYAVDVAVGAPTVQLAQVLRLAPGDCLLAINVWRLPGRCANSPGSHANAAPSSVSSPTWRPHHWPRTPTTWSWPPATPSAPCPH